MHMDAVEIRRALDANEFIPFFQPLVVLRTGQLAGFEVLARWQHHTRGLIPPNDFIPSAEKEGWIDELMDGILQKAFTIGASIPEHLTLSVNISPVQMNDMALPGKILSVSQQTGFAMDRIIVEITESGLMGHLESAQSIVSDLKAMGCKVALDDFGTGYSSLLHLHSLPFDDLKVDQSFVSSMKDRRESRKIVAAVIGLGQSLGLTTVGEGVETQEQAEMLLWMGCEIGQGWLFGRPVPAAKLPDVMATLRPKISLGLSTLLASNSMRNFDGLPAQRLAQLQAVYDGAPVGLAFLDRELRYVSLNQRLAVMNGLPVEDHLARSVADVLPEQFAQVETYIRQVLDGEGATAVEVTTEIPGVKGVRALLLSNQPAIDEEGEIIGVSMAVVDVTERKRAVRALRESEDHYRHMVEFNPQTPWIMDPEGKTLEVSPEWESTTGLTKEESRDHGWLDALHPDDVVATERTIAEFIAAGLPISVEYRVRNREGGWKWMRSRGAPRFDAAGQIVCWYGSVEDIDERKQLEDALRETEAKLQAALATHPVVAG
jgi:PAS domain S-box-containing protein